MSLPSSQLQPFEAKPSTRKLAARCQFQSLSVQISDATDYGLQETLLPNVVLSDAREALKNLPESLSQLVIEERQTS